MVVTCAKFKPSGNSFHFFIIVSAENRWKFQISTYKKEMPRKIEFFKFTKFDDREVRPAWK